MGKRERKKYHLWHKSPYDGVPGFYAAVQRFLYQIEGPSQLGRRGEPAYVPPVDPKCPICSHSMTLHRIDRGGPGKPTHLRCPSPEVVAEAEAAAQALAAADTQADAVGGADGEVAARAEDRS